MPQNFRNALYNLFHPSRSNNQRARVLHPSSIFKLLVIVLLSSFLVHNHVVKQEVFGQILGFSTTITPDQIIDLTNKQREKVGLPALMHSDLLSQAALSKADHMFAHQYWSHTAPDGTEPWDFIKRSGYTYSSAGENLARDFFDSQRVVLAWMASPTHKANIMHTKYSQIGVAVVSDKLDGVETAIVVQMFGRPLSSSDSNLAGEKRPKPQIVDGASSVVADGVEDWNPSVFGVNSNSYRAADWSQSMSFSPLQITKAILLAVVLFLVFSLIYDTIISHHWKLNRMVGDNLAHLLYLGVIAFLLIYFKAGIVG